MRCLEVKGTLLVYAGRAAPQGSWVLTISGRLLIAFYPQPGVDPEPAPLGGYGPARCRPELPGPEGKRGGRR